jgi:hypothetical protein
MEWLWLLSRKQRMLVEILNKLEQIMAKQADQDRAIAGLRTAFETEKTEIRAALDALTTEISSLRTEGSISDASIAELDRIAQEIAGATQAARPTRAAGSPRRNAVAPQLYPPRTVGWSWGVSVFWRGMSQLETNPKAREPCDPKTALMP